jgi:hypothetical protein
LITIAIKYYLDKETYENETRYKVPEYCEQTEAESS